MPYAASARPANPQQQQPWATVQPRSTAAPPITHACFTITHARENQCLTITHIRVTIMHALSPIMSARSQLASRLLSVWQEVKATKVLALKEIERNSAATARAATMIELQQKKELLQLQPGDYARLSGHDPKGRPSGLPPLPPTPIGVTASTDPAGSGGRPRGRRGEKDGSGTHMLHYLLADEDGRERMDEGTDSVVSASSNVPIVPLASLVRNDIDAI